MKTKIFDCETEFELEEKVNSFLEENEFHISVVDLKMNFLNMPYVLIVRNLALHIHLASVCKSGQIFLYIT